MGIMECQSCEMEDLVRWAASLGITDSPHPTSPQSCLGHSLTISTFPTAGGRGLGAVRDLKKGELILTVPKHALLSLDVAMADHDFAKAVRCYPNLLSVQILSVCLLREVAKGSTSAWYPYLKHLPRSFHNLAHFSDFETKALQVEDAVWIAENAAKRSAREWEEVRPVLFELRVKSRLCTFKAWLWASATVTSRTVHIPWDNAGALCPIGDLFNYTPPHAASTETKPNVSNGTKNAYPSDMDEAAPWDCHDVQSSTKLSNESGTDVQFQSGLTDGEYVSRFSSYCFYAHEDYKAGDQVLLCYGSYNSLELLEHYGFLLQYNPNDEVYVTLPQFQDFVLRSLGLLPMSSGPNVGCYIQVDGRPSFSLLRALRLHFVSSDLCRSRGYLAAYGMQITVESDLAAYDWLLHRCKEMIASLPTTLGGDAILHEFIRTCCLHDNLEKLAAGARWENFQASISSPSSISRKEQQDILDEMDSFLLFHDSYFRKRSKYQARLWLERWGLSVEWRLCYKRILHRCVDFCLEQLKCLITI